MDEEIDRFNWMAPPGRRLGIAAGVAALASCIAASVPGGYFGWMMLAFWAWVAVYMWWSVRALGWLVTVVRSKENPYAQPTRPLRWLAAPLIGLTTAGIIYFDGPHLFRYRCSRPAMDRLAQARLAGKDVPLSGRIGLYHSDRIRATHNGVRFLLPGTGFLNRMGYAYAATGTPPNISGEDRYTPIEDGWFLWEEDW